MPEAWRSTDILLRSALQAGEKETNGQLIQCEAIVRDVENTERTQGRTPGDSIGRTGFPSARNVVHS